MKQNSLFSIEPQLRAAVKGRAALVLILALLLVTSSNIVLGPVHGVSSTFTFAVSGDLGQLGSGNGKVSLETLNTLLPSFFLALGDLSYNSSITGDKWCQTFKNKFNNIEIIPGAHDTGEEIVRDFETTHSYEKFIEGCPFTLTQYQVSSSVCGDVPGQCYGSYGKEYYFDYPATDPLARFILISPGIYNITGSCGTTCITSTAKTCNDSFSCWPYRQNDSHYNWTSSTIDGARGKLIKWIIVGAHKPCIAAAKENCAIGGDIFNLLIEKKVDLIITGTDHAYERGKQLSLNPDTCPRLQVRVDTWVDYQPDCVVDDGHRNFYYPGAGTVVLIAGTFGGGLDRVNDTTVNNGRNAAEAQYFARLMGANTAGNGHGFVKVTVSPTRIDVQTSFSSTFQDTFSITRPPFPTFVWSPVDPQPGDNVTFTGTVSEGRPPYNFTWSFGDGTHASGDSVYKVFPQNNLYNVTLVVIDSLNSTGAASYLVGVGSWNPNVNCSPVQSTIEEVIGNVPIQRDTTDSASTGADYSGGGFRLAGTQPYGSSPGWPFSPRSLHPPCLVIGTPTLVELHGVAVRPVSVGDCGLKYDSSNGGSFYPNGQTCSVLFNVANPVYPQCPTCYMHRLYSVIDRDWVAFGVAPPIPARNQTVDLQGFVYWNPLWVNMSWHSYSGWEVRVVAWRASTLQPSPPTTTPPESPRSSYFLGLFLTFAVTIPVVIVTGVLVARRSNRKAEASAFTGGSVHEGRDSTRRGTSS